jgi:YD repeat-containing protein
MTIRSFAFWLVSGFAVAFLIVLVFNYFQLEAPASRASHSSAEESAFATGTSSALTTSSTSSTALVPSLATGELASCTYNSKGQLATIHYSDGSTYSYGYDQYGDKIQETSRSGNIVKTFTYVYDATHKPIRIIDPDGRDLPVP